MGEYASMAHTERLNAAGAVLLADAEQWLDEVHPAWRTEAPDHVLDTAMQAILGAWGERSGGNGTLIAAALAHQVAHLIVDQEVRSKALAGFDRLLSEFLAEIDADDAGAR